MLHAVKNSAIKSHNHSVSPKNYDNGLGYAPRTIRLFNQSNKKEPNKINATRVDGKIISKDNIFHSIQSGKGKLKGRTLGRFRQSQQPNTREDYPQISSEPKAMVAKYSMPVITGRIGTENSSIASHKNSQSSQMSVGHGSEAEKNSNIMQLKNILSLQV